MVGAEITTTTPHSHTPHPPPPHTQPPPPPPPPPPPLPALILIPSPIRSYPNIIFPMVLEVEINFSDWLADLCMTVSRVYVCMYV